MRDMTLSEIRTLGEQEALLLTMPCLKGLAIYKDLVLPRSLEDGNNTTFHNEQEFWENIMPPKKPKGDYVKWGLLEKQIENRTNYVSNHNLITRSFVHGRIIIIHHKLSSMEVWYHPQFTYYVHELHDKQEESVWSALNLDK